MALPVSSFDFTWIAETLPLAGVEPWSVAQHRRDLTVFWEDPAQGLSVAGFGVVAAQEARNRTETFEVLERIWKPAPIEWKGPRCPGPWFGGLAFDLARPASALWAGFPASRWILPELMVWKRENACFATAFGERGPSSAKRLSALVHAVSVSDPPETAKTHGNPEPFLIEADELSWRTLVERALSVIEAGIFSKVVAARSLVVKAAKPLQPLHVLGRLRQYSPRCATFLFRGTDGSIFLGATPETLCHIEGTLLETEALAGSSQPGDSDRWVLRDKEQREHKAVIDAIVEGLSPLCESLEMGTAPEVLTLPNMSHLKTPVRARLRKGVGPPEVVRALHPTPAVGGWPRDRAMAFLAENEVLERGWYAGAVGFVGEQGAELKAALRCALIRDDEAHIFVGAGIVAGSTAQAEWEETQSKSVTMLAALGAQRD